MKLHALLILTALLTSGTGIAGTGAISFPQNGTPLNMDEGGPGQTVTLERTGGSSGSVTVTVAAEPITTGFNRTPVSPTVAVMEYRLPPPGAWTPLYWNEGFPVTFADTETSASFEIRPIDNNAFESSFGVEGYLVLKDAAAPATIGSPPSVSVLIRNDDPMPMLLSGSVILPEGNGDTPVLHLIHIVLDRPVAGFPATPFLRVLPRHDSAREGFDFQLPAGGAFADWVQYSSSFTIPIEIIPDSVYEGDESLGHPGGSYVFDFGAGHSPR